MYSQKTGAQIKVYSQVCPESTERVVAVGGKPKVVVDCIETIHELLLTVSLHLTAQCIYGCILNKAIF